MSSCNRRFVLTAAALALTGCGFTPAYAPGGPAATLLDRVAMDAPTDKNGFDLVERLEERLGRSTQAGWQLGYHITTTSENRTITPTNAITRYNLNGSVDYTLTNTATGAVATHGTVSTFTSYSASGTVVATRASETDAGVRLMRLLADQIVMRLIATSGEWGGQ